MKNKKLNLLYGLVLSIGFIFLGFSLFDKVSGSSYPILITIVAYACIVFFGFLTIIGILALLGKTKILRSKHK